MTVLNKDGTPRQERKRSPRPKKKWKYYPKLSEMMRKRWADPEWRAKMTEKLREAARKRDPATSYRRGVPDGMRKAEAMELWAQADELSRRFIKLMEDKEIVEKVVVPESEEAMAKEALREAFKMAVSPLTQAQTKTSAIRTVLEWTKAKPESKAKLTLNKAEEWLADVAADNDGAK